MMTSMAEKREQGSSVWFVLKGSGGIGLAAIAQAQNLHLKGWAISVGSGHSWIEIGRGIMPGPHVADAVKLAAIP